MSALRALVVDDERLARQNLRRLLAGEADIEVVGECASGTDAVEAIRRSRPDLVFLDVQMPGLDGFGVLREVGVAAGCVVFVTAHDEHAVRAFAVNALDYLLKPFDRERLRATLDRVRRTVHGAGRGAGAAPRGRVVVRAGGRIVLLPLDDIVWIESADNYARLHTRDGAYLVRETLLDLEGRLPPGTFVRVHRGAIVNVAAVADVGPVPHGGCELRLRDGRTLSVGRTRRRAVRRVLRH